MEWYEGSAQPVSIFSCVLHALDGFCGVPEFQSGCPAHSL